MTTEFRVLGAIEVLVGGRVVEVGHARPRAVLAVLLANANRTVPVDQLADRVWGQTQSPDDPRGALRTYVSVLRKALAEENGIAFVRQSSGYKAVLDERHVDLHRFHDLLTQARATGDDDQAATIMQEALELWRGEPFTGLDTPWINATRQSLLMQRQAARLDLTDIQLRRGQHARLLSELIRQADEHPLDERIAGQLMLALYRSGRQADSLAHYQRLRTQLADEVGTDPGPAVRQLYQQILTADPALTAPVPNLATRQARPTAVPRQLPAAPRLFTGRNRELARLTKALDKQTGSGTTLGISVISGAGGIGKTWLALRWAHQHAGQFPDGQLYVNLRGFDPSGQPMSAEVAVRGFLDALGVAPDVIPAELDAQVGLYRSLLADKRMLILLDNAREAAQVMPLLPGSPTCTILITSRQKLTGLITAHGARTLDLEMLPEDEARGLLACHLGDDRVAAEPDAVATLLAWCAGLPLALSIIAARAITQPGLPLAVLAHELQDASTRLDALDTSDLTASLHATLSWSYDALTPDAARALDLLALAPGPDISAAAAASLTALPLERLRTVLRDLEHACLLQQHAPGRYRMHDLIRLYATEHAARHALAGRGAALRRVLTWYLHTADAADRVLAPTRRRVQLGLPPAEGQPLVFDGYEHALAWCDAEQANLVAAVQAAAGAAEYEIAWKLPLVLAIFFEVRKPWADWIACGRTGVAAARHAHDAHGEAWALSSLATAYRGLRRFEDALDCLQRSSRIRRENGDLQAEGAALNNIGTVYGDLGQFADAAECFRLALAIARDTGNTFSEGIALCNLSGAYLKLRQPDEALDLGQQALALARETGYRQVEGLALNNLGAAYSMLRRARDARERYQQALDVYQWAGDRHGEAEIRHQLGDLLLADGDITHARVHWQHALAIFDELGDRRGHKIRARLENIVPK